jgi:hypothetical protein
MFYVKSREKEAKALGWEITDKYFVHVGHPKTVSW